MELGKGAEERFKLHLEQMGFIVTRTGQEMWLDSRQHEILRYVHGNVVVDFVRHFPNFVVVQPSTTRCFLAEAKSTSEKYREGENFSIERACFDNLRRINAIGVDVLVAFENQENEFFGQWIQNVPVKHFDPFETSRYFCGSGTPAALIIKKELPPIDSILRESLPLEKENRQGSLHHSEVRL